MEYHDFHEQTGIASDKLHFVRRIENKSNMCRRLGVSHFVDDRLAVLELMPWLASRPLPLLQHYAVAPSPRRHLGGYLDRPELKADRMTPAPQRRVRCCRNVDSRDQSSQGWK